MMERRVYSLLVLSRGINLNLLLFLRISRQTGIIIIVLHYDGNYLSKIYQIKPVVSLSLYHIV